MFYDAELNVYYDAGGKIIGGPSFGDGDGYEINLLAESPVEENGSDS